MRRISARERLVGRLPTAFAGALALGATIIGSIALGIGTAGAAPLQPAFADTFRIGNAGPVCEAQSLPAGATRRSVYDRKGIDTQRSVLINGEPTGLGGPFNPRSTINGCLIGRECSISIINVAPSHPIIEELLKPPTVGGGGRLALSLAFPIVQYGSTPLIDSPPLIDEPVTGLGNDDLWQQR